MAQKSRLLSFLGRRYHVSLTSRNCLTVLPLNAMGVATYPRKMLPNMHAYFKYCLLCEPVMCKSKSGFGFKSGFKLFLAGLGFGFGFRPQKPESGFGFKKNDSGFESGFKSGFKFSVADHNPTKLIFHCSVIYVVMDARPCVKLICILKKKLACI